MRFTTTTIIVKKAMVLFFLTLLPLYTNAQEVTTYYLIRHAEKQRLDPNDRDPSLTSKGFERANRWRVIFENVVLDAVYSTDYKRTKLTAKPTADSKNLPILLYNPREVYSTSFRNDTKGKQVLVVGHSNTTPAFVNTILGDNLYAQIDDNNNANLYIVTMIDGKVSVVVLKIE